MKHHQSCGSCYDLNEDLYVKSCVFTLWESHAFPLWIYFESFCFELQYLMICFSHFVNLQQIDISME